MHFRWLFTPAWSGAKQHKGIQALAFVWYTLLWRGWRENSRSRVRRVPTVSSLVHGVCCRWICNVQPWTFMVCNTRGTCANVITHPPSQGSPNSILGHQGPKFLSLSFLISSVFTLSLHRVTERTAKDRHGLIKQWAAGLVLSVGDWKMRCMHTTSFLRAKM